MKFLENTISIYDEVVSYEMLWANSHGHFKSLSELFKKSNSRPSELVNIVQDNGELRLNIENSLELARPFRANVKSAIQFPERVEDALNAFPLIYHLGDLNLLDNRMVSVVGTRKISDMGVKRTKSLVKGLVKAGFTIVSGLAAGVDTVAMNTAIEAGGTTIGVIGTPINRVYPKENETLQHLIADKFLLLSHVPIYLYPKLPIKQQSLFFPQRNELMSALTEATIIIEASDTSGTLIQARECLRQGRKLFILNSCFENKDIIWPHKYLTKGAIRVNSIEDILNALA